MGKNFTKHFFFTCEKPGIQLVFYVSGIIGKDDVKWKFFQTKFLSLTH